MSEKAIQSFVKDLINSFKKNKGIDLESLKRVFSKKYNTPFPRNSTLLKAYREIMKKDPNQKCESLERALRVRPVRSLSGIVNVSVLTAPYPCPHRCLYCPAAKNLPKSYLEKEPAVQRAIFSNFHPYKQVVYRLKSLWETGHPLDKIELRIIGGTWSYYPRQYQNWFIRECFRACNEFPNKKTRLTKTPSSLQALQKTNEKSNQKIVGITVETRPDYITKNEIKQMRKLGITRVELGVQSVFDDVLEIVKRGHSVKDTIEATRLLKDAGFKVLYQMMPNLPGSNFQRDIEMFEILFNNPDFRPDLLKIYPLAIIRSTPLYQWYKKGKLSLYNKKELVNLLVEIKKRIPYWVRIQRIIRDFPSSEIITGGVKTTNLRELVQEKLREKNLRCHCIRCREVKENFNPKEKIYFFKTEYEASRGQEFFLSFENKERTKLFALLRLRFPSETVLRELGGCAIVRELHTYGQATPLGKRLSSAQHRGLGKKLMIEAEKIARMTGFKKMAVIAGVGTRDYYRKLGYRLQNTYMIKKL